MSTNFENSEEKRINCEGGFGIIPHRLRKAENININAKFLFLALIELQHEKGYCYASNKYLASQELNGVSVRSIQNWLNELEENGWIKTEIIRGDKNEVIQRRIYTNLNQNTPRESTFTTPRESTFTYKKNNIEKKEKENTKRKAAPASGSPSSPKVDELRLAEEIFENRFWVLVQNKIGKEKSKKLFFRITNNCKSEEKVNEVVEGYKRYLSFLEKNKANNFNRRPKDPATFLNLENKLWLEPWKFNEDEVGGGSWVKQPENWKNRIIIAKRLGLLENFEREEIKNMYGKEWRFIPNEAKQAIASEKVDVEYNEHVEQKRKQSIEHKEKTLKKREKEVECKNLGEKLKQLEFEIKKPFLSWIEKTFDLSSLIKDFKTHMFLKFAVPENVSEFSMLEFYKEKLWISSEIDRKLEEKLGDNKEFVEKKHEYENELKKHDEEFKKHKELVKEIEDLDKDITNLAAEQQKF